MEYSVRTRSYPHITATRHAWKGWGGGASLTSLLSALRSEIPRVACADPAAWSPHPGHIPYRNSRTPSGTECVSSWILHNTYGIITPDLLTRSSWLWGVLEPVGFISLENPDCCTGSSNHPKRLPSLGAHHQFPKPKFNIQGKCPLSLHTPVSTTSLELTFTDLVGTQ